MSVRSVVEGVGIRGIQGEGYLEGKGYGFLKEGWGKTEAMGKIREG